MSRRRVLKRVENPSADPLDQPVHVPSWIDRLFTFFVNDKEYSFETDIAKLVSRLLDMFRHVLSLFFLYRLVALWMGM